MSLHLWRLRAGRGTDGLELPPPPPCGGPCCTGEVRHNRAKRRLRARKNEERSSDEAQDAGQLPAGRPWLYGREPSDWSERSEGGGRRRPNQIWSGPPPAGGGHYEAAGGMDKDAQRERRIYNSSVASCEGGSERLRLYPAHG